MKKADPYEFFKNQAKETAAYFHSWLYGGVFDFDENGEPLGIPQYCELYDVFEERAKKVDLDTKKV